MANVTHTCEFYSIPYEDYPVIHWKIIIEDTETVGSDTIFKANGKKGFIKQFDNTDAYSYTPIGSRINIDYIVETQKQQDFLDTIIVGAEGQFIVYIYKDSVLWWIGTILTDLSSREYKPFPYKQALIATDYIGTLKEKEYLNGTTLYEGKQTIIEHLTNVLYNLPQTNFFPNTIYIKTAVEWDENNVTSGNILENTRFDHDAFIDTDSYEEQKAISKFEVLQQICERFNARLYFAEGAWWFEQISIKTKTSYTIYNYEADGTYHSTQLADLRLYRPTTENKKKLRYSPPLLSTTQEYEFKEGTNDGNLLAAGYDFTDTENLGTMLLDGALQFSGTVKTTVESNDSGSAMVNVLCYIRLRVGDYYFTNENNYDEWINDGNVHFYTFYNPPAGARPLPPGGTITFTAPISFITPPIPITATGEFYTITDDYIDGSTPPGPEFSFDSDWVDGGLFLTNAEGWQTFGTKKYIAENTTDGSTLANATKTYQSETMLIGDGPNPYSVGALQIYTGSEWQNSDYWNVDSCPVTDIGLLAMQERLALQKGVRRFLEANIIGYFDINKIWVFESITYISQSGKYNARENQYDAEFIELDIDRTNINLLEPLIAQGEGGSGSGGSSGGSTPINQILDQFIQQGYKVLNSSNSYSANVTFNTTMPNVNYTIMPPFATDGNNIIPVQFTNKTTTGFTVTARSYKEVTFFWAVLLK